MIKVMFKRAKDTSALERVMGRYQSIRRQKEMSRARQKSESHEIPSLIWNRVTEILPTKSGNYICMMCKDWSSKNYSRVLKYDPKGERFHTSNNKVMYRKAKGFVMWRPESGSRTQVYYWAEITGLNNKGVPK